jgi:CSLREA domain-containing protein
MPSIPLLRTRPRALLIISFFVTTLAVTSVWTVNQRASIQANHPARGFSSGQVFPNKSGFVPLAGSITVNSVADVANGTDGLCTLREAITAANNDAASGALPGECAAGSNSGADVISFSVTGTINLASALPDLSSDMTIAGPGSSQLTVRRNTAAFYRIFTVSGGTVGLSGLTARDGMTSNSGGFPTSAGGGIRNSATLTMTDVIVTANQTQLGVTSSSGSGGGIFNEGTLTMTNCSVTGNTTGVSSSSGSGNDGGGIANIGGTMTLTNCVVNGNSTGATTHSSGTAGNGGGIFSILGPITLTNTTISNNVTGSGPSGATSGSGGGIYNNSAVATIVNSTISGNATGTSNAFGGGVLTSFNSTLRLVSCTITGNTAANDSGDGVFRGASATATVRNTIIAGNGSAGLELMGAFTSQGHNLIGRDGGNGFTNGVNGDQVGTLASPLDPHLGPLANNGGATMTHELLSNSTALDAGDDCVAQIAHCGDANISQLTTDQRGAGFGRQLDGPDVDTTATVDIGAFELQPPPLADLGDTSTNEDTQLLVLFNAGDTSSITSVTANSSSPTVVPNDIAHLDVAISGSTGTVTINPAANVSGTTDITVTVNRTSGNESKTFTLTVNSVNDAPSFTKGADQTLNENAAPQTINNWATAISPGPLDESGQALTFQVTGNTNAALFSAGPAISSTGTLTYTLAANQSGSATITLNLKDDGGTANGGVDTSASQSFTITVNPAPSLGNYSDTPVALSGNVTITPDAPPTATASINVSTNTSFQGTLIANPSTGTVRITNARPAGAYPITVRAFNGTGLSVTRTFTLTVQSGVACTGAVPFSAAANVGTANGPVSVAIGDFNSDGKQDLAIVSRDSGSVSIRLGDGAGGFVGSTEITVGGSPRSVAIGDFNNDGKQDLATASTGVSIRLGDGAGGFTGSTTVAVAGSPMSVALGDFNNDGFQDFATANVDVGSISIRLGDGVGNFTGSTNISVGTNPESVAVGDFNSDGKQDLAVAIAGSNSVSIRLGDGLGGFSVSTSIGVGSTPTQVAIGDFNSDGKQDFATANMFGSSVSIRLGDGLGGFSGSTNVTVGGLPQSVAIADFNNDGKQDLVTANNATANSSVRFGNGLGGFSGSNTLSVGGGPTSVAVGDFNGDGRQDFAVATFATNSAAIRLGGCNVAPTITAQAGVSRQQGSAASNSKIATVTDDGGDGAVTVTVASANPANGITISNIVNTAGNITADIVASCAASNATFTLQAADGSSTATDTLTVTAIGNTAPSLSYATPQAVAFNGSLNVTPTTTGDNGPGSSYSVQSVSPALTTAPTVNTAGVVSITGARPAGSHVITIRSTDNCGLFTDASFTLNVSKGDQTISFAPLADKTFGDPDFNVNATASSGLPVSFSASGNCAVNVNTVHLASAGSCTITASQAGDTDYNAAPNVARSFTTAKANQTITFGPLTNKTVGDPDFNVSASASSGLVVSFGATGNCIISTGTVHITGAGSCTITASQAGDTNYNAAANVPQSFTIAKAQTSTAISSSANPSDFGQSITFTITVTSTVGTPGGTIQLKDNDTNLGSPLALNPAGVAVMTTSALTAGSHTLTADYSGSGDFLTSTGTVTGGQLVRPALSVNDASVLEGDSGTKLMNFTVTLSASSNINVNLAIATANGTAFTSSDYVAINDSIVFTPGETSKTVSVTINGDINFEADEAFTLNLSSPVNATISRATGTGTIQNDDAQGGLISLSQSNYNVSESAGFITLTINRTNDVSRVATVDYATDDAGAPSGCGTNNSLASSRCDFTRTAGTLSFAAGEIQKTFSIPVSRDSYAEGPEMFTVNLSNPTGGAVLAAPFGANITIADDNAGLPPNAIDDVRNFVRQHYHDFLNREPDQSGWDFWTNQITSCGNDAQCNEVRRIDVSASFFLSIEFQQTGYLVERFYKVSYGDGTGTSSFVNQHQLPVPIVGVNEFLTDTQRIGRGIVVLAPGWEQALENNKQAYALEFIQTTRFTAALPTTMTPAQFVTRLNQNAGGVLTLAEQQTAIDLFGGAGNTTNQTARAQAVRTVAEDQDLYNAEFNRAFVLAQYFGYLRRNPNDAPDNDYTGYDFWLTKLNQFNGNYINAEMVKAFLSSIEYRQRFGQ